jgi:hypothetical protein
MGVVVACFSAVMRAANSRAFGSTQIHFLSVEDEEKMRYRSESAMDARGNVET